MQADQDERIKLIFNDDSLESKDRIPLVIDNIQQVKKELNLFLSNTDYDLKAILSESSELCDVSEQILNDMKHCKDKIENETMAEISKSIENCEAITKDLISVEFALDLLETVVQCDKYVKDFDSGREAQSFSKSVKAVSDMLLYMDFAADSFKSLDFYNNTKHVAQLIYDNLVYDSLSEWDQRVFWDIKVKDDETVVDLTIRLDKFQVVIDLLNALEKSDKLPEKITKLCRFLMKDLITPIVKSDCIFDIEDDSDIISLIISNKEGFRPKYNAVIANIRLLFYFLGNKLNIEYKEGCTLMKMISKEISEELKETLVNDCFIHTIPNNLTELQTYMQTTSEIENLQRFLIQVNIFPENGLTVLDYTSNIDNLFAKKSSIYFLETARSIMLRDLSSSMSIGIESIPDESIGIEESSNALKIFHETIPISLFYFPRCMISRTAQELLDLVYEMMEQAVQCSNVVSKKLFRTTRLVFELYDAVVPYHHENYLQTIPQYVALFHNNCMYLAHNLQTLGDKWLILMEGRDVDYPISYLDIVQKLRDLGCRHLTAHMQYQRKQILDNIRSSDLNNIATKDVLESNAEAAVRQCLRQLSLLRNVWIGVFPTNVFTKLMATLINMFVEELIHRVCTVEDIAMEISTQITDIYSLVVKKVPPIFQNERDVEEHVKSWPKLQELLFILDGSLKDIERHWADGTGPLAMHFKTEELRNLIKALFQNTQLRANLLSKLK